MSPSCISHCSICPAEATKKLIENHCKTKRGEERLETMLHFEIAHIVIDIHTNTMIEFFPTYDYVYVSLCFMNVICVFMNTNFTLISNFTPFSYNWSRVGCTTFIHHKQS